MSQIDRNRVVFYSKEDGTTISSLRDSEQILENLDLARAFEINDLLELYNIKLFFDNDLFLNSWSEIRRSEYKRIIDNSWELIRNFWLSMTDENILFLIESLEIEYTSSFWKLFSYLQAYKKISKSVFSTILDKFPFHIYHVLESKQIVEYYGREVKDFLIAYENTAEIILSKIEIQHIHNSPNYHFPSSLSIADKETIISKYIDREKTNLNYIRIIEHSRDSDSFKISPKTRLSAKKKSEFLNDKLYEESSPINLSVEVNFRIDQDRPFMVSNEDGKEEISYSVKYLDEHDSDAKLFFLFRKLFSFANIHGVLNLVSKENELIIYEKLSLKSKNEYVKGILFERKNRISHMQIILFDYYLKKRNNSIEKLTKSFIDNFINSAYKTKNLRIDFPTDQATYLEKVRILSPEIDSILKQYQVFVNEGYIDFELISIDSTPLRFSEIKSLVEKKYVYINNDEIHRLKHIFFSDQSVLYYIEPYKNKYSNLYDLLVSEKVRLDNFEGFQLNTINYLIKEGYLSIDLNGFIELEQHVLIYIIRELNEDDVISYWYYDKPVRAVIDEMIQRGLLKFENTLFTKPEINFFNYYLNKKEFTNGFDIRNKYLHGTNEILEKKNEFEYYTIVRLLILVVIKIEDDLRIHNFINNS